VFVKNVCDILEVLTALSTGKYLQTFRRVSFFLFIGAQLELGRGTKESPNFSNFFRIIWYDMIYLLTAIGSTRVSSTVHIYIQTIHRTTQFTN